MRSSSADLPERDRAARVLVPAALAIAGLAVVFSLVEYEARHRPVAAG